MRFSYLCHTCSLPILREDIRSVAVVVRSNGPERLDPARLDGFTLTGRNGEHIPLQQIGHSEIRMEDPILRRYDRIPTITLRADVADGVQPPSAANDVRSEEHTSELQSLMRISYAVFCLKKKN